MLSFIPVSNPLAVFMQSMLQLNNATRRASLLWVLAIATEKNIPVISALDALADESKGKWQSQLNDFTTMLQEGTPLAEAAASVPGLLADDSIMVMRAAAESGTLVNALRAEAERISQAEADTSTRELSGILIYTVAVATVGMAIVTFLMTYIIPKFKKIFEDFGVELPGITYSLIETSDLFLAIGFLFFPLVLLIGGLLFWLSVKSFKSGSTLAMLSRVIPRLGVGSLLRSMSHVIDAGKPLAPAVSSIANHHPSPAIYRKMSAVFDDVDAGDNCWESMYANGLLKQREVAVIRSAERAGNCGWALRQVGKDIDRTINHRFAVIVELIRPVFLIGMGLVVGFVVIGLFAPLVKLANDLS